MRRINERRQQIEEESRLREEVRFKGRITSSKLAAQGHFQLDQNVRDAVKKRVEEVEQEEKQKKQKKQKRLQNEEKQKEKYNAAKQKETDPNKTLTIADKRQICRYERMPTDPTSIMSMTAAEVNTMYAIIRERRQPEEGAAMADVWSISTVAKQFVEGFIV